jgi:hypothetical protein
LSEGVIDSFPESKFPREPEKSASRWLREGCLLDIIGNNVGVSLSAANDANFAKNRGKFARIREIRGQDFHF